MPHESKLEARSLPNFGDRVRVHRTCSIEGCRACTHCNSLQCKGREPPQKARVCAKQR